MRIERIDYRDTNPDHEWCGLDTVRWTIVAEPGDDPTRRCLYTDYVTPEEALAALQ
jgi:hypothetical protein